MTLFLEYANHCIPFEFLVLSSIITLLIVVSILFLYSGAKKTIVICWVLFAYYYINVCCSTVFYREPFGEYRYDLIPFRKLLEIINSDYSLDKYELILNVIMFVPLGIIFGRILKMVRFEVIFLCGIGLSINIEILQLVLQRGLCETNDIITNVVGFIMGYTIITVTEKLYHSIGTIGYKEQKHLGNETHLYR